MTRTINLILLFILSLLKSLILNALLLPSIIFNKKIRQRVVGELNFKTSENPHFVADICFEFSSEGEFEQVLPIIDEAIKRGEKVELIYCSPSVDKKVKALQFKHPNAVKILYLPLLTNFFAPIFCKTSHFVTANKLVLCRYDFFLELLSIGLRKNIEFILVSATLKNKKNTLMKIPYAFFDKIIPASKVDRDKFLGLNLANCIITHEFDFRTLQIKKRFLLADEKYKKLKMSPLITELNKTKLKKIIFGSYWPIDIKGVLSIIENSKDAIIFIAPHSLNKRFIENVKGELEELNLTVLNPFQIDLTDPIGPGVYLMDVPGVLCEFYQQFDFAYVSGGFGKSIHSVLEPFMAGCFTFCGPRTHRSTEIDFITQVDSTRVAVLKDLSETFNVINNDFKNLSTWAPTATTEDAINYVIGKMK